jgi:hypothetical protein
MEADRPSETPEPLKLRKHLAPLGLLFFAWASFGRSSAITFTAITM